MKLSSSTFLRRFKWERIEIEPTKENSIEDLCEFFQVFTLASGRLTIYTEHSAWNSTLKRWVESEMKHKQENHPIINFSYVSLALRRDGSRSLTVNFTLLGSLSYPQKPSKTFISIMAHSTSHSFFSPFRADEKSFSRCRFVVLLLPVGWVRKDKLDVEKLESSSSSQLSEKQGNRENKYNYE